MCGICGFIGNNNALLPSMCDSIAHRGPDAEGTWSNGQVHLGMRRLSIVDLSAAQPVYDETKRIVVVMNGEIYNYIELKKELDRSGHRFKYDHSDTELIPHLYEEYGVDWVAHTNGMFAVALYDAEKKVLFLFRDRIGKKPLYYTYKPGKVFAFASEIKSLLHHPEVSTSVDEDSFLDYLAKKTTIAPKTIYKDVHQLLPGSWLCIDAGMSNLETTCYWRPTTARSGYGLRKEEFIEKFLELFTDSVRIRTRCDVPFGAYLSGGVDSSSVVSVLASLGRKVKTFCLGYNQDLTSRCTGKEEDIDFARRMSKLYGTDHYEIIIDHEKFREDFPRIIGAFDEPFSGTVSTYFVSSLIKDHVKVALSGDGADELFGSYLAHRLAEHVGSIASAAPNLLRNPGKWRKDLFVFNDNDMASLIHPDLHIKHTPSVRNFIHSVDHVNQVLEEDQSDLLPNQVLPFVDRLSMAHSVEVRCPYLDYRIIELVNSAPGSWKVLHGKTKIIQKEALAGRVIPKEVTDRKKEGFVQPVYSWMEKELSKWVDDLLVTLPYDRLNKKYVMSLDKRYDHAKIWNLVCLSVWWNSI